MSHSPTPWRTWQANGPDEYPLPSPDDYRLIASDNISPGVIWGVSSLPDTLGNAEFIVRAVNCHDDLVRFLGIFFNNDARYQVSIGGNPIAVDRMLAAGRELLAAARGEPVSADGLAEPSNASDVIPLGSIPGAVR